MRRGGLPAPARGPRNRPALSRAGDWYGSPVNLASRVTRSRGPGSVVGDGATREATAAVEGGEPRWQWSSLPSRRIKGVEGSVPLYRARLTEDAERLSRSLTGAGAASASSSSASVRRSESRWPQRTSRSSARRWPASSSASRSAPGVRLREAGDDRALQRHRAGDPLGERGALLRQRAQRREPLREAAALGALGLQQGAQREQVVGQRLERRAALARHLEAPSAHATSPRARRAAGDEVAEGAQLVLLRGARASCAAGARGRRCPAARVPRAAVDARPRERPERERARLEQPQRAQQPAEARARGRHRRAGDPLALDRQDRQHGAVLDLARRRPDGLRRHVGRAPRRARARARRRAAPRRTPARARAAARSPPRAGGPRRASPPAPRRRRRSARAGSRTRSTRRRRRRGRSAAPRRRARARQAGCAARRGGAGRRRCRRSRQARARPAGSSAGGRAGPCARG